MTGVCECGQTAVQTIDNGKHVMPVCATCWVDVEAIAVEVLVEVAGSVPITDHGATTHTVLQSVRCALGHSLAARSMTDDGSMIEAVVARWREWYTPS